MAGGPFDVGSIVANIIADLSGRFFEDGFQRFKRAIDEAEGKAKPGVEAKLGAKVEKTGFEDFKRALGIVDRSDATAKLKVEDRDALFKMERLQLAGKKLGEDLDKRRELKLSTAGVLADLKIVQHEADVTRRKLEDTVRSRGGFTGLLPGGIGGLLRPGDILGGAGGGAGGGGSGAGGLASGGGPAAAGGGGGILAAITGAPGLVAAGSPAIAAGVGGLSALVGSAGAGVLGAGALGVGGAGALGVGFGSVLAVAKPVQADIKTTTTLWGQLDLAIARFGADSKQAANIQEKLAAIQKVQGPEVVAIGKALNTLGKRWDDVSQGAQKAIFGVIAKGLAVVQKEMPFFAKLAETSAKAMGVFFDPIFKLMQSRQWEGILKTLAATFAQMAKPMGQAAANTLLAFGRIAQAAAPFVVGMAQGLERLTSSFEKSTRNRSELSQTIGGLVDQFKSWLHFAGALSDLVLTFFGAGAAVGKGMLDTLTSIVQQWTAWMKTKDGQQSLQGFFRDSRVLIEALLKALAPLVAAMGKLVIALMPAFTMVIRTLTPLFKVFAGVVSLVADALNTKLGRAVTWLIVNFNPGGAMSMAIKFFSGHLKDMGKIAGSVADWIVQAFKDMGKFVLGVIDTILGGIQTMAHAASKVPILGDAFSGVARGIGDARKQIREWQKDLDSSDPVHKRHIQRLQSQVAQLKALRQHLIDTHAPTSKLTTLDNDLTKKQDALNRALGKVKEPSVIAVKSFATVAGSVAAFARVVEDGMKTTGNNLNAVLGQLGAKALKFTIDHPKVAGEQASKALGFLSAIGLARGGPIPGATSKRDDHLVIGPDGLAKAAISGTEGILTDRQMAYTDYALAVTKLVGAGPYGSLGELWAGERTPHGYAKGGPLRLAVGGKLPGVYTVSWFDDPTTASGKAHVPGWAELSDPPGSLNFSALGHLPMGTLATFGFAGKNITIPKVDVGAGGSGLGGAKRGVDLTREAAAMLPGFLNAGLANMMVSLAGGAARAMEVPRLLLKGPAGALQAVGQKALDRVRDAGNAYIAVHQPTGQGGGAPLLFGKGALSGYAFPLPDFASEGRVDRGQDMEARHGHATTVALGPGVVTAAGLFFPGMQYRLTAGPLAGHTVFHGHNASILAKVGQSVVPGQPLGTTGEGANPEHTEIGFMEGYGDQAGSWSGPGSRGGMMMHSILHAMAPNRIGAPAKMASGGLLGAGIRAFAAGGSLAGFASGGSLGDTQGFASIPELGGTLGLTTEKLSGLGLPVAGSSAFIGALLGAGSIPSVTPLDATDRQIQGLDQQYSDLSRYFQLTEPGGQPTAADLGVLLGIREQISGLRHGQQATIAGEFGQLATGYGQRVTRADQIKAAAQKRLDAIRKLQAQLKQMTRNLARKAHQRQAAMFKEADRLQGRLAANTDKRTALNARIAGANATYSQRAKAIRDRYGNLIRHAGSARAAKLREQMNRELRANDASHTGQLKGLHAQGAVLSSDHHKLSQQEAAARKRYARQGWGLAWALTQAKWKIQDRLKALSDAAKKLTGSASSIGTGGLLGPILSQEKDFEAAGATLIDRAGALPEAVAAADLDVLDIQRQIAGADHSADVLAQAAAMLSTFKSESQSAFAQFGSNFIAGPTYAAVAASDTGAIAGARNFGATGAAAAADAGIGPAGAQPQTTVHQTFNNHYQSGPEDPHLHAQRTRFEFENAFG